MALVLKKEFQAGYASGNSWDACGYGKTIELARLDLEMRIIELCPDYRTLESFKAMLKMESRYMEQDCSEYVCSLCGYDQQTHDCNEFGCGEHICYGFDFNKWQRIKKEYKELRKKYKNVKLDSSDPDRIMVQVKSVSNNLRKYFSNK